MKIISTCMYSEPHESTILFLKLFHESPVVDEWILVENDYTHRGEYKGFSAEQVMSEDRMQPYKDKVIILKYSHQCIVDPYQEAFHVERAQRDHALTYIQNHYTNGDWIITSDIDEFIDFRDLERKDKVLSLIEHSKIPVCLPLLRYWYDFDNRSIRHCHLKAFPFELSLGHPTLEAILAPYRNTDNPNGDILAFEYSHCYPKESIRRKWKTNAHGELGVHPELLDDALKYNWWVLRKNQTQEDPAKMPDRWFETIRLTEENSPAYVREHLSELKLGNIDPNYRNNRRSDFPQWFPTRRQTNPNNKGIFDYNSEDKDSSETRSGFKYYNAAVFSEEKLGNFKKWIQSFAEDGFVVELGCGSGVISTCCNNYIGLDANIDGGSECVQEYFPVDLSAPYDFDPPVEADVLLSFAFFEHIEENLVDNVLSNADKLLKSGAKIFFFIDKRPLDGAISGHITIKPHEWWDEKLQKVGWKKDEITAEFKNNYFNNLPSHWYVDHPMEPWMMIFLYHKE